jgi:ribonuclease Z
MFRAMLRWQSEGFCFQSTGIRPGAPEYLDQAALQGQWGLPVYPEPVLDPRAEWVSRYRDSDYRDDFNDGYAVVPIELKYDEIGGQAYKNDETGLKITHYPVVHTRRGAIGYKVEWNGLSMMYTSDTKPEQNCIEQAKNVDDKGKARGVDVFIHEMAVPPEVWAMKLMGLDQPGPGPGVDQATWDATVEWTKRVQDSSHTTQGAFGYLLSQIKPRPRLAVATHFIVADDTVNCALKSVQAHCPEIKKLGDKMTWSFDLMVLRVYKNKILQRRAVVDDYSMVQHGGIPQEDQAPPKYYLFDASGNKAPNPTGQIDPTDTIPATNADGSVNYREDGY